MEYGNRTCCPHGESILATERADVLKLAEEFGKVEGPATDFASFVEVLRGRALGPKPAKGET
jgi:hypothetical protein